MKEVKHKLKQTNASAELIIQGEKSAIKEVAEKIKISQSEGLLITKEQSNINLRSYLRYYITAEETLEAEEAIKKIIRSFSPQVDILNDLQKKYGLKCHINLLINIVKNMPPGIVLDDSITQFASKLNAAINIDMRIEPIILLPK